MRLHCLSDKCVELPVRGPRRQRKAAGRRPKYTRDFGQHPLWPLHVEHAEGAGDGIDAFVGKRDRLGVADTEIDTWMAPDCLGDHGRGEIHSDNISTTPSCRGGKCAGATGNIQNAHTGSYLDRFQQWVDGPQRNRAHTVVPVPRLAWAKMLRTAGAPLSLRGEGPHQLPQKRSLALASIL